MPPERDPGSTPLPPAKPRKRWKWLRRIGLTLLLIVVALVGGHGLWGCWASRQLAGRVEALRKAGEPVTVEDLATPGLPDAPNAVSDLRAAAASIDETDPAWRRAEEVDWSLGLPLSEEEAARIEAALAANSEALRLARSAVAKPDVDWSLRFKTPILADAVNSDDAAAQRKLANLLAWAAVDAHHRGDDAEALRRIDEVLFVGAAPTRGRLRRGR